MLPARSRCKKRYYLGAEGTGDRATMRTCHS
jgi:hypothetical protein